MVGYVSATVETGGYFCSSRRRSYALSNITFEYTGMSVYLASRALCAQRLTALSSVKSSSK